MLEACFATCCRMKSECKGPGDTGRRWGILIAVEGIAAAGFMATANSLTWLFHVVLHTQDGEYRAAFSRVKQGWRSMMEFQAFSCLDNGARNDPKADADGPRYGPARGLVVKRFSLGASGPDQMAISIWIGTKRAQQVVEAIKMTRSGLWALGSRSAEKSRGVT